MSDHSDNLLTWVLREVNMLPPDRKARVVEALDGIAALLAAADKQAAQDIAAMMERMAKRREAVGDKPRAQAFWMARNIVWDMYDLEEQP